MQGSVPLAERHQYARLGETGTTCGHRVVFGMVTGLIAVAMANEKIIQHPHADGSLALSLLLSAGPILFLAPQGWFLGVVVNTRSRSHWAGSAALLVAGGITIMSPACLALILIGTILATLAIVDQWARAR